MEFSVEGWGSEVVLEVQVFEHLDIKGGPVYPEEARDVVVAKVNQVRALRKGRAWARRATHGAMVPLEGLTPIFIRVGAFDGLSEAIPSVEQLTTTFVLSILDFARDVLGEGAEEDNQLDAFIEELGEVCSRAFQGGVITLLSQLEVNEEGQARFAGSEPRWTLRVGELVRMITSNQEEHGQLYPQDQEDLSTILGKGLEALGVEDRARLEDLLVASMPGARFLRGDEEARARFDQIRPEVAKRVAEIRSARDELAQYLSGDIKASALTHPEQVEAELAQRVEAASEELARAEQIYRMAEASHRSAQEAYEHLKAVQR
ncbi:MAG: hypothetical protein ACE366_16710 [Bradymonadia bacterium]